ncbi:MAG: tyrosine-protein phosphatase [Thermomicrobiales bacterium]
MPDGTENRYLRWDACYNARDLGGLPTRDGARTRWGALIRADSVGRLTEQGRAALEAYGIRTIIDLRFGVEVRDDPSPFTDHATIIAHNLPLNPNDVAVTRSLATQRGSALPYPATVNVAYLATHQSQIAAVMRAIAGAPEGGILFHCHAGRDRTGLIAALLLAVADVPAAVITADYALSFSAVAETMDATLAHLEDVYGGVEGYLRTADVTESEIARIRNRLRDDSPPPVP